MVACGCWIAVETIGRPCDAQAQSELAQPSAAAANPDDSSSASPADQPAPVNKSDDTDSSSGTTLGLSVLRNIALDQAAIWPGLKGLRPADIDWLAPFAAVMATSLAVDARLSAAVTRSPQRVRESTSLSNYGLATLGGVTGGLYVWGALTHDDHEREAGLLSGEAAIDAVAVSLPLQFVLARQRPSQGSGQGFFERGGTSFPSDHSAAAWAAASVIAHEYPGPLTKLLAYGLASAVSVSRVTGEDHFPTDVVAGAAIGWLFGQYVYRAHHDTELGGGSWESFPELRDSASHRNQLNTGSPYIPLDSWIYAAIDRLAALGSVDTAFEDTRPWTRLECAALVQDAGEEIAASESASAEAVQLYDALQKEFPNELATLSGDGDERSLRLESAYTDVTAISGQPLNDSDHFGQTIIDNFGRPYEEGFNTYDGFSAYSTEGRFTLYVRGEFQRAPSGPAYPLAAREAIASADENPLQPATPVASANQFRLLDTYVAANWDGWELSAGKQSLWWGQGQGGALLFSDNAEPIYMFRASPIVPLELPWIFCWLGPAKVDFFFGKLSGNQFPPRPLIHGERISFKGTPNLEWGLAFTTEMGGVGRPLTLGAIFNSFFSVASSDTFAANDNPGKRTIGFDFQYRLPHLRNWLTLYANGLVPEDNPTLLDMSQSPIHTFNRTAWRPGIYLPRLPHLPKTDLRVEAVDTDPPTLRSVDGRYVYWNDFYHDLYVNKNNLIGDWIGREGMGLQSWTTYWFSPRNSVQLGYRHAKVAGDFIPGGETVNDGSVQVNSQLRSDLHVSASVQYEKWAAPILAPGPQTDWTSAVQLQFSLPAWSGR
jgi:membrane-associated phospholipid phosphatase